MRAARDSMSWRCMSAPDGLAAMLSWPGGTSSRYTSMRARSVNDRPLRVSAGYFQVSTTSLMSWYARRLVVVSGTSMIGGSGGPLRPHAARSRTTEARAATFRTTQG